MSYHGHSVLNTQFFNHKMITKKWHLKSVIRGGIVHRERNHTDKLKSNWKYL